MITATQFLSQWFGYPGRESLVGNPHEQISPVSRVFLRSPEELMYHIKLREKSGEPCYLSVQPFRKRNQVYCIEKVYADFDCKNDLDKAWSEASTFIKTVEEFYSAKSLICFSGNKGYNTYTFLQKPVLTEDSELAKELYGKIVEKLFKGLQFQTVDPAPAKDIARLSRIPYTIYERTRNHCTPVTLERNPLLILSLEGFIKHGLSASFIDSCQSEISTESKLHTWQFRPRIKHSNNIRPCITRALTTPLEEGAGHMMRLAIAAEHLNKGYSVDQTAQLFRGQVDYGDGSRSRYFVQDISRKHYKPLKCKTIQQLGYCLPDCPRLQKRRITA